MLSAKLPCKLMFGSSQIFLSSSALRLLTCDAAVGGHHHGVDPRVFDDVLPVDCVCMTQELVLVDVHASTQDLCREERQHMVNAHTQPTFLGIRVFLFLIASFIYPVILYKTPYVEIKTYVRPDWTGHFIRGGWQGFRGEQLI